MMCSGKEAELDHSVDQMELAGNLLSLHCSDVVSFHCSYVVDLTYYLLTKADGKSWQGDPAVERLVEARTVSQFYHVHFF